MIQVIIIIIIKKWNNLSLIQTAFIEVEKWDYSRKILQASQEHFLRVGVCYLLTKCNKNMATLLVILIVPIFSTAHFRNVLGHTLDRQKFVLLKFGEMLYI